MDKEDRKGHCWFVWNLANIISIGRAVAIFWVFFIADFSNDLKLLGYFLLLCTDKLDGMVARKIGNTEGIGKIIDPTSDKADKFMFLIFLLISGILVDGILNKATIAVIFSGEVLIMSIVVWGIYLSVKHQKYRSSQRAISWSNYKVILNKSKEEILLRWKVELIGKAVMFAYAIMVLMLYLHRKAIWREDITELLCVAALTVGLFARAVSIVIYGINVYKAQKELF